MHEAPEEKASIETMMARIRKLEAEIEAEKAKDAEVLALPKSTRQGRFFALAFERKGFCEEVPKRRLLK